MEAENSVEWEELPLAEQIGLVEKFIERVEYDGQRVSITFKDEPVMVPQEEAA